MDWFLAEDWNLLFPGSNWSQILIFLQSSWFCSYMHHVRIDWSEPTIMVSHIICIYLDRCLAIHTPFCFGLLFGETPRIRHWFLEQDQQTPPKNFDCFKPIQYNEHQWINDYIMNSNIFWFFWNWPNPFQRCSWFPVNPGWVMRLAKVGASATCRVHLEPTGQWRPMPIKPIWGWVNTYCYHISWVIKCPHWTSPNH